MTPATNKPSSNKAKGESIQQRRLTRQSRLRYRIEQDADAFHSNDAVVSSLPASPLRSTCDRWSSSAVPQPLPLPESPLTRRPDHLHALPFSR